METSFGEKRTLWLDAGRVVKDSESCRDSGTVPGILVPGLVLGARHPVRAPCEWRLVGMWGWETVLFVDL